MKIFFLFLAIIICQALNAQEFKKIERNEIERLINDKTADTYYPKLLSRFLVDDSTLTNDDYRLLYYGFVYQKNYSGYPDLKQTEINEAIDKKDYKGGLKMCNEVLAKIPINLFANYNKGLFLYKMEENDVEYLKYINRYKNIMNAVISTGDGLKCETAFKTIFVNDEYQIIYNYFKVDNVKGQALEMPCDKMHISATKYFEGEFIYFDTSETFIYMDKMFKNE